MKYPFLLFTIGLFILSACEKDEKTTDQNLVERGILVANQGKFPDGNGAVTWINDQKTQSTDLYSARNGGAVLGNTVQSVFYHANKYFIAVNNAASIEVVDQSFKKIKTFNNLGYTRYFTAWGNKVIASAWGVGNEKGKIYVINESLEVEKTIEVAGAPEKMLVSGTNLWVSLSNGFGVDSLVARIDLTSGTLQRLTTVDKGPNSFVIDELGRLIVLCEGYFDWLNNLSIPGGIFVLQPDGGAIKLITVPQGSANLCFNPNTKKFYFNDFSSIYEYKFGESTYSPLGLPSETTSIYGLGIDVPNNILYYSDPKDFASQGLVYSFHPETQKSEKFEAAIVPGQIFIIK